ncbi:competence protein CoiA [Sutcliffiella horikoshii]|uniref:competence protein CoiA n=1 Tax=Sutcliffiella horikoshii TaxID=79883 RepID=UPI003850FAB5
MFVAIDQFGNKLNPIETEEEELRLLSKSKMLFCPECLTVARFASGEQVTAHFKHVQSPDCTYDSEPETEEHLKGKMQIRNWLVKRYPEVYVEFEYKIKETNQRADVIAIFPDGKRVAFEMQCSKIQGSVWKERHALYKKAGIQDFWILGNSVHKYGKTEGKEDRDKHQLLSLASTIYQTQGAVLFLNTNSISVRGLYKHKFKYMHSDTIMKIDEEIYSLEVAKIYKNFIGTDAIKDDFKTWYVEKLKKEKEAKEQEEKFKREQERQEREYEEFLILKEKKREEYLADLNSTTLEQVKTKMTNNEKELFERLLKKHGYNDANFPGIFNVFTDYNYMFHSPPQLWQLWIYDKYIYRKNPPYDKVWVPKIKDQFYKMRESGVFRFKYKHGDYHFSFAIYEYFERLNLLNLVEQLGYQTTKYHQIMANELPPFSGKEMNNYIAYYLSFENECSVASSDKTHEIREVFLLYKDMIRQFKEYNNIQVDEELITKLEYAKNLLIVSSELGNEWEIKFISKMADLLKNNYKLSQKQYVKVKLIIERIEKQLNISLVRN